VLDNVGEIFAWQHDPIAVNTSTYTSTYTVFDESDGDHTRVFTYRAYLLPWPPAG
jgi:hypothetical protein